jgi:hypothetical protein
MFKVIKISDAEVLILINTRIATTDIKLRLVRLLNGLYSAQANHRF